MNQGFCITYMHLLKKYSMIALKIFVYVSALRSNYDKEQIFYKDINACYSSLSNAEGLIFLDYLSVQDKADSVICELLCIHRVGEFSCSGILQKTTWAEQCPFVIDAILRVPNCNGATLRHTSQQRNGLDMIPRHGLIGRSSRHKWGSEISILASVRHPGIVRLHGILETPQHYLMITEICEGGSLSSHLNSLTDSDLGFKEYTVQEIVRQLTSALVYLHNRSIVHRDVKPDNVLLVHNTTLERLTRPATKLDSCAFVPTPTKPPHSHSTARPSRRQHRQAPTKSRLPKMSSKSCDTTDLSTECEDSPTGGGGGVSDLKIKLVDFGMAVELEGMKEPLVGLCGTPLYMAPEVLSGRSYTRQCDVWSLGIIAYQLLCKDFPYCLQMERKPLQEVDRRTPKLVSRAMADHVGFCARHWLLCVLQPDPVQRFSAAELLRHDWLLSAAEAGDDLGSSSLASFRGCLQSCCVSSDNTSRGYGLPIVSSNIFSFMRAYKNEHHGAQ